MQDSALDVTGGTVEAAKRVVKGENRMWNITIMPAESDPVEISLPATTDCGDTGAICTQDGRMLSNAVTAVVPATGAPTISGTAQVGETLTANTSGIADPDGLSNASFSYQWIRNDGSADTDIQDATGSTYTLTSADEGKAVKVRVSFTDDGGNDETLASDATGAVAAAPNRAATGTPSISGTVQVGETLTADTSDIADEDGLDNATFSYQWVAGGTDIDGATGSSYTLADNDAGKTVQVRVSFTDDAGNHESLTSQATEPVTAKPNSPATGLPIIVGNVQVGETLTADTSGITDEDGLTSAVFKYEWLANDAVIAGANDSSYIISDSDRERAVRVRVSFTDDRGFDERLTSNPVGLDRPYELTASVLDGGVVLTWKPPVVFPYLYDYQILRNRPELGEAEPQVYADTGNAETTYTDTDVEPGVLYVYRVKAANYFNHLSQASEPVEIRTLQSVPTANSPATGTPTISGTAQVGATLTADTLGIADEDGFDNVSFSYQWLADDADISGATNASYTLTDSDEGKTVKVTVTFTDDAGNEESVTSAATDAVASPPTPLTASIRDAPESHDGENSFTFELRFSETPEPDFSYEALRDDAFTVSGGTVTKARRIEPPGNVRWEITVEPSSDAEVSIVLPVTTDCDDQGPSAPLTAGCCPPRWR